MGCVELLLATNPRRAFISRVHLTETSFEFELDLRL